VVVVHCKAGKGRTGICCAALLLHLGKAHTWSAALAQFAIMRTSNCVGVTIASQRRWVQYFDALKDQPSVPDSVPIRLSAIRISNLPSKYANRVIIVVQQREYSKEAGYHNRTLVAANTPPPPTATSSMFGSFMCGVNAGGGLSTDLLAVAAAERCSSAFADSVCSSCKDLRAESSQQGSSSGRVHCGYGWRLSHSGDGTVLLEFDTADVRSPILNNDMKSMDSFRGQCLQ
jgi:phosphatidylinositol-3,4,5-trisphosphate 3-phosphatase/dual-specificity protein phosphatase PTEN